MPMNATQHDIRQKLAEARLAQDTFHVVATPFDLYAEAFLSKVGMESTSKEAAHHRARIKLARRDARSILYGLEKAEAPIRYIECLDKNASYMGGLRIDDRAAIREVVNPDAPLYKQAIAIGGLARGIGAITKAISGLSKAVGGGARSATNTVRNAASTARKTKSYQPPKPPQIKAPKSQPSLPAAPALPQLPAAPTGQNALAARTQTARAVQAPNLRRAPGAQQRARQVVVGGQAKQRPAYAEGTQVGATQAGATQPTPTTATPASTPPRPQVTPEQQQARLQNVSEKIQQIEAKKPVKQIEKRTDKEVAGDIQEGFEDGQEIAEKVEQGSEDTARQVRSPRERASKIVDESLPNDFPEQRPVGQTGSPQSPRSATEPSVQPVNDLPPGSRIPQDELTDAAREAQPKSTLRDGDSTSGRGRSADETIDRTAPTDQPGQATDQPGQTTDQPGQATDQPGQATDQPGQATPGTPEQPAFSLDNATPEQTAEELTRMFDGGEAGSASRNDIMNRVIADATEEAANMNPNQLQEALQEAGEAYRNAATRGEAAMAAARIEALAAKSSGRDLDVNNILARTEGFTPKTQPKQRTFDDIGTTPETPEQAAFNNQRAETLGGRLMDGLGRFGGATKEAIGNYFRNNPGDAEEFAELIGMPVAALLSGSISEALPGLVANFIKNPSGIRNIFKNQMLKGITDNPALVGGLGIAAGVGLPMLMGGASNYAEPPPDPYAGYYY